jgi:hypothetical protein
MIRHKAIVGLMLIKDEQDVLEETLSNHLKFCDMIFVLDGTIGTDRDISYSICRDKVYGYWTDEEVGRTIRDGSRQFLLDKARDVVGSNNWYVVLHGDEIWGSDPRPLMMDEHEIAYAVKFYHFFPHISQRSCWEFGKKSIEKCCEWYMVPPTPEVRIFFDAGLNYDYSKHSRTVPIGLRVEQSDLIVKSYNYRSPEQAHRRAVDRKITGWQTNHYAHLLDSADGFFVSSLAENNMKWNGWLSPGEGDTTNTKINPLPII